jgi:uncharacterized protein HemY
MKEQMDSFREINWSEVMRQTLAEKIRRLQVLAKLDAMLEKSVLTDEDALRLGREAKRGRFNELKKLGLV